MIICGTRNDRSVRYSLGRSTSTMAVAAYTYDRSVRYSLGRSTSTMAVAAYTYDQLPASEQKAFPNEGHLGAALDWAEPAYD